MLQPALVATKVVCLSQAVSADELKEDEDYEDIVEDMRAECSKFGNDWLSLHVLFCNLLCIYINKFFCYLFVLQLFVFTHYQA